MLLLVHPVVLGSGQHLFGPDDRARRLRLLESTATETRVVVLTYEPKQARG
ncbi:hypothetical protein WDZ17_02750 [Pseudokineococcus basanitobsidens]|uniref:RibD domain-containing protein n=1 Tax=Pseudokineococcus basanitobsidens TaxID=1926649 RepID=A0ABU8RGK6_9ACTN